MDVPPDGSLEILDEHFILSLDSPEATLEVAGGKGACLSRLARAGFPVPTGFLITTAAYGAFVQANGLAGQIVELGRSAPADDPTSLEDASQAIRQLFDQGVIPQAVATAIRQAYGDLCPAGHDYPPVAVRSSATAEDLPGASFAGQQETYLNVRGEEALLEAVKRCWSSLWTARAMAYRARQGIASALVPSGAEAAISLAVVVQLMVSAEAAGVLFTVNPLTGDRDEAVINAAWGLGEAVVGGRVTPDMVVVDKATGRVKSVEVGDKAVMMVPAAEGTVEVPVALQQRRQPVLTPEQAAELTHLGREIEAHFGGPQDVEWAIAGGRAYILQARPVTALPGDALFPDRREVGPETAVPGDDDWPALGERPAQPFDLWTQSHVGEALPHPMSPLTWSGTPIAVNKSFRYLLRGFDAPYLDDIQWVKRFYGRIYANEGAVAHVLSQEYGLPGSFLDAAFGSRRSSDRQREGGFRPFRFLCRLPGLLRATVGRQGAERGSEALFTQIDRWFADFTEQSLDRLSDRALWAEWAVWMERFKQALCLSAELAGSAFMVFAMLEWLMARCCGRKDLAPDLVTGLSGVYAAEMGPALWQMAQVLHDLGLAGVLLDHSPKAALAQLRVTPDARPVIQMLDAFLERHGHRCPNEMEWLHPRWAEAPEQVIEVLASYLQAGDRVNPVQAEARQRRRREEAVAWVEAHLGPIRRAIFWRILARVQHLVRLRDNQKHYLMKVAFPLCRVYRMLGQRWVGRGWLKQPDDVFFLTIPDIEAVVKADDPTAASMDLPALVAERRQAYEYWFDIVPPEVIGPDGQPVVERTAAPSTWLPSGYGEPGRTAVLGMDGAGEPPGAVLQGIPASGGQVRGTARIIRNPREATRLQAGDILVTRSTDPGWTPVFSLLGGLVLEVGGQLSHGAIVAREYGVPAVVNVHDATRRIPDGQTITVDGTAGRVLFQAKFR